MGLRKESPTFGAALIIVSLITNSALCGGQLLDIRQELRNQIRFLEVKREGFDQSFLGMQVQMYAATKEAEDYLRAHRLQNPLAVFNDPFPIGKGPKESEDDMWGPRLYALVVSLGKSHRDSITQRLDRLRGMLDDLNKGALPGFSAPPPSEAERGKALEDGVKRTEDRMIDYDNKCNAEEWTKEQIQTTVTRANDIESLVRQMYQAQDEVEKRRIQQELDQKKREADEQRRRLEARLNRPDPPDRRQGDGVSNPPDHPIKGEAPIDHRIESSPLDKGNRDMIRGVMGALERQGSTRMP